MSPTERHLAPSAPMLLGRLYHESVCVESESKFCLYMCIFTKKGDTTAQDITCMCDVTSLYIDFKLTLMSEV